MQTTETAAHTPPSLSPPRAWKGPWLIGVAAIHTLFAALVFPEVLVSLITHGLYNSVGHNPMRGAVVWFVLFGVLLALLGASIWQLEETAPHASQAPMGWGLCALALLGVILMPESGFWLVFPPAVAMLRHAHKMKQPIA